MLTDRLSDLLFTHSPEAADNLAAEGIDAEPRPLRRQHDDRLAAPLRRRKAAARRPWRDLGVDRGALRARHAAPAVERGRSRAQLRADRRRAAASSPLDVPVRLPDPPAHPRAARGRGRCWIGSSAPACAASTRSATSTSSSLQAGRRARSSPTPAACRRRPRRSAFRASRCGRTPSARSRSSTAPTPCSARIRLAIARHPAAQGRPCRDRRLGRARGRARRRRHRRELHREARMEAYA